MSDISSPAPVTAPTDPAVTASLSSAAVLSGNPPPATVTEPAASERDPFLRIAWSTDPPVPEPAAPAPAAPGPSVFEKAKLALKGRETLQSEINQLRTEAAEKDQQIAQLTADLTTARAEAEEGRKLAGRVAQLEDEATTVQTRAAQIAAANHAAENHLPPAISAEDPANDIEGLQQQMAATDDPREKGRLAGQIAALRTAGLN